MDAAKQNERDKCNCRLSQVSFEGERASDVYITNNYRVKYRIKARTRASHENYKALREVY